VQRHVARSASWLPGELPWHFGKHGHALGLSTIADYDASARDTIRVGKRFTYRTRLGRKPPVGYYDPRTNRFTALTRDEAIILTHVPPTTGAAYVRGLPRSSYR
jgi:pyocin large subunit-like protein